LHFHYELITYSWTREDIAERNRDKQTKHWIILHTVKIHSVYSSTVKVIASKSRRIRLAEHVVYMQEIKHPYRTFVTQYELARQLEMCAGRKEGNIKMDVVKVE
jgi:hypothetical protein